MRRERPTLNDVKREAKASKGNALGRILEEYGRNCYLPCTAEKIARGTGLPEESVTDLLRGNPGFFHSPPMLADIGMFGLTKRGKISASSRFRSR
ncbi:MAG: hypothetical protein Q8O98_00220 [bacterium]|nr:hypothetical protein [bacterium]